MPADVLVLCAESQNPSYRNPLAQACRVALTASPDAAIQYVARAKPSLVILDGDQRESLESIFDALRAAPSPPVVLITLSQPEAAGQVVDKCDSILLKPFAPNLLIARVARLLRDSQQLRSTSGTLLARGEPASVKFADLSDRQRATTMIEWPTMRCRYCDHMGIVLIDYTGQRRAWYSCPACRKVWIAKRHESR